MNLTRILYHRWKLGVARSGHMHEVLAPNSKQLIGTVEATDKLLLNLIACCCGSRLKCGGNLERTRSYSQETRKLVVPQLSAAMASKSPALLSFYM